MKNYLFTLTETKREVQEIEQNNPLYIRYDNYLKQEYFTTIEDNEDFISMQMGDKIIIVFKIENVDEEFAENIFDVMQDQLYMRA